ncbi:MAG TPA: hypothetical protein PLP17_14310, partial [Oligoflexia bacterium]|nr:hypothetical protein [Oligoflexia bacterium]
MRARIALFAVFSLIFGLLAAWILLAHYPLSGLKAELELASRENGDVRLQYGPGKEDYVQMSPQNTLSALAQTAQNELEITVLGEKHAAAQGAEVWLLSLFDGDGRSIPWQELRFEPGCDLAKGAPMCSGAPSAIRWRGKSKGLTLRLLQHPWSGKARVTVNGRSSVLDLYSPEHKSVVMFFGPRQWQAQLPALPITDLYLTFENGFRSLRLYRLSLVLWNRVIWSTTTQQFVKDAGKGEVSCGRGGCRIETPYSITLAAKGIRPFPISRARLVYGALFVVGIVLLLALLYCCGRYWFRNALIPAQCTRCDLYGSRTLAIASLCVLHLILSVFLVLRSPTSDLRSVMGVADTYLRTGIFAWGGDTPAKTLPMPILFTFGKDGYAHLAYEQGIPWLYAIMMAAGRAID